MIYLLFVFIATLSIGCVGGICARKGVVNPGKKFKLYQACTEQDIIPYEGKKLILITILCFVSALALQISLYNHSSIINFIKLYGLFLILISAAIVDSKRRIVPNSLILIGLAFRIAIYIYEIIYIAEIKAILLNDFIGFTIGFVFLAIVSLVTKGAMGFGDVKLFGIIGLISGSFCTYSTLLISLILSTIFSLVAIGRKKMGRKDAFPFAPCIAIGYVIVILLKSY